MDLSVLQAARQPLDEDVVRPAPAAPELGAELYNRGLAAPSGPRFGTAGGYLEGAAWVAFTVDPATRNPVRYSG